MADAGNFGGSIPERKRNTVLSPLLSGRRPFSLLFGRLFMSTGLRFTLEEAPPEAPAQEDDPDPAGLIMS